jgi:pimeloyl-ACP methyl ester carboxylesterase
MDTLPDIIMKIFEWIPPALLALLLIGAIWGKLEPHWDGDPQNPMVYTVADASTGHQQDKKLYVLVPGLGAETEGNFVRVRSLFREHGDVLTIGYPGGLLSNANPIAVADRINEKVQTAWDTHRYSEVVLVGNSMGALLARKAMLLSAGKGCSDDEYKLAHLNAAEPWADKVSRLILLAGMNRGWDVSGQKPSDMRWYAYAGRAFLAWFGKLTHNGQLVLAGQTGSPFVADLRLEWMQWMRETRTKPLQIVQLLGDIDDLVSPEDNEDLRVSAQADFVWLKVRGTGHADLLHIVRPDNNQTETIEEYRYNKLEAAAGLDFEKLKEQSEELPPGRDDKVTHVVFIMHGIRDLGEWSSIFETRLHEQMKARGKPLEEKLAIASVRYGYFGMGQFLLRRDRQKYVNWFMDQYTETLARYPKVNEIHFIGHSNGTYLLTSALEKYRSLKINRLVLGGSVVRTNYDWDKRIERKQVQLVNNYVASDDLVVALLPRFFEAWPASLLGNDIGSAGFNGFATGTSGPDQKQIRNIKYIQGGHDAFLDQTGAIAEFLLPTAANKESSIPPAPSGTGTEPAKLLQFSSDYLTAGLWAFLVFVIFWLGSRVSGSAGDFGGIALILYIVVVLQVLRWV